MTWREYTKYYRDTHPEQALRWKLNSAKRLLQKNGYKVIDPEKTESGD